MSSRMPYIMNEEVRECIAAGGDLGGNDAVNAARMLAFVRGLGVEGREDRYHLGGLALAASWPAPTVLTHPLRPRESFTALVAAIFVGRHTDPPVLSLKRTWPLQLLGCGSGP